MFCCMYTTTHNHNIPEKHVSRTVIRKLEVENPAARPFLCETRWTDDVVVDHAALNMHISTTY